MTYVMEVEDAHSDNEYALEIEEEVEYSASESSRISSAGSVGECQIFNSDNELSDAISSPVTSPETKEVEEEMNDNSCKFQFTATMGTNLSKSVNIEKNINDLVSAKNASSNGVNNKENRCYNTVDDAYQKQEPIRCNNLVKDISSLHIEESDESIKEKVETKVCNGINSQERSSSPTNDVRSVNFSRSSSPLTNGHLSGNSDDDSKVFDTDAENKKRKILNDDISFPKRIKPADVSVIVENGSPARNNCARKRTGSAVVRTLKDFESTIPDVNGVDDSSESVESDASELIDEEEIVDSGMKPQGSASPAAESSSCDNSIKEIFKNMSLTLSRRQLEEIVLQKVLETINENNEIARLREANEKLRMAGEYRKNNMRNLEKQIRQLKGVLQVFSDKLKNLPEGTQVTPPIVITRSVGLQVDTEPPILTNGEARKSANNRTLLSNSSSPPSHQTHFSSSNGISRERKLSLNNLTALGTISPSPSRGGNSISPSIVGRPKTPSSSDPDDANDIIDLTDKEEDINEGPVKGTPSTSALYAMMVKQATSSEVSPAEASERKDKQLKLHPAPFPVSIMHQVTSGVMRPPRPDLTLSRNKDGISLSWTFPLNMSHVNIAKYQIFAYKETSIPYTENPWKSVGDVDALPLPIECTLIQFSKGYRYHFAVRAVDDLNQFGLFSIPKSIFL